MFSQPINASQSHSSVSLPIEQGTPQTNSQPLAQLPKSQQSEKSKLTQKITPLNSKHEIQKLIQEAGEHIEENTEQLKEGKRRRATFLTSVIFNSFLVSSGFLTFMLFPTLSAILIPPVGFIVLGSILCPLLGSALIGLGSYRLFDRLTDEWTETDIQKLTKNIEALKRCQQELKEDSGFAQFLSRFETPYDVNDLIKYRKLFRKERSYQQNQEKSKQLKELQDFKIQRQKQYHIYPAKENLIDALEKMNDSYQGLIVEKQKETRKLLDQIAEAQLRLEETDKRIAICPDEKEREALENRLTQINDEISAYRDEIKSAERTILKYEDRMNDNHTEIEKIQKYPLAALSRELNKEVKENQQKLHALMAEIQLLKVEIDSLDYEIRNSKKSNKDAEKPSPDLLSPYLTDWYHKPVKKESRSHLLKFNNQAIYAFGNEEAPAGIDNSTRAKLAEHGYSSKYRFLSNDDMSSGLKIDGITYKSVTHYFHAQKAKELKDDEGYYKILDAESGKEVRRIANVRYRDYRHPTEERVMKRALFAKFVQVDSEKPTPDGVRLMQTAGKQLIDGHRKDDYFDDNIWGAVFTHDYGMALGENRLGELLMELREWLIQKNPKLALPA